MNFSATNDLVNGGPPAGRVRGLRPSDAPVHLCRHCGLALSNDDARASGFCCAGCAYVFRLVQDHGLGGYYKIRDAVIPPPGDTVFLPRDYAWLSEQVAAAESAGGDPELLVEIQGISCAACVWLIEKLFHQQPGTLRIETDAQLGRMRFRWQRGNFDAPGFARTLQSFNYVVGPLGSEPPVLESRQLAKRVGLASAFSMNVMLFTLPVYFGMEHDFAYAGLFASLSMVFATFSVLSGGTYFLGRAWAALRARSLHIDLPIAIGIIGAYLGSLYGWISGIEAFVYFDFVASFILLMLVGRWAQTAAVERNRRRLLKDNVESYRVRRESAGGVADASFDQLKSGDVFWVGAAQPIPVESRLLTAAATVGTAWINGEADSRPGHAGSVIPAGAINLGAAEIRLRAEQSWNESLLAQLLQPAPRNEYRHRLLERIVGGYLVGIFVIATATGVGWWLATGDVVSTWSAVTAVLVVSCPCAIGLAFPLTEELATTALRRDGIFIRVADLWPRLGRVRRIVFDKTGTLTPDRPALANGEELSRLQGDAPAALLAMVANNPHPISRALHEELLARAGDATADAVTGETEEIVGQGLRLYWQGAIWSLGRPGWRGRDDVITADADGEQHGAELCRDGNVIARFEFVDGLRPGVREEFVALRRRRLELFILSGDRRAKVTALAAQLGLPPANAVANATPQDKARWLREQDRNDTMMIGDGANDSLAFDAAFVRGTPATHRGVLESKADFYYIGRGVASLRRLLEVDAARRRTQAWLLAFSVLYNALAVGLAAFGHMSPLLAAVLMPVSSLLTLAIVAGGRIGR